MTLPLPLGADDITYPDGSFFSPHLRHKHKVFVCDVEHEPTNLNQRLHFHRRRRGIMTIIQTTPSVGLVKYSYGCQLISASLFSSVLSVRRQLQPEDGLISLILNKLLIVEGDYRVFHPFLHAVSG